MTPMKSDVTGKGVGARRARTRLRGMFSGERGKAIGFTSVVAPILGYVVNDLRKPNSIVRKLIGGVIRKLLPPKSEKLKVIDITDEVEILDDDSDRKNMSDLTNKHERS
ncbi:MAG: hypothetical protein J7J98_07915 [candidate division Zixibacteria bacterium]|nr:hypothetical protein [candidate division Zixibacteria bacterium]